MGVFTYQNQNTSTVAPAKLYKAFVKDCDTLIPKAVECIQSVEIVEGNGGPGTVKKFTFNEGGQTHHVLHKVEAIDEANFVHKYSIVGGSHLPDTIENITFDSKLEEGPNGGSIAKATVTICTKGDAQPSEEEVKGHMAQGNALFKAIETYIIANPDYN